MPQRRASAQDDGIYDLDSVIALTARFALPKGALRLRGGGAVAPDRGCGLAGSRKVVALRQGTLPVRHRCSPHAEDVPTVRGALQAALVAWGVIGSACE